MMENEDRHGSKIVGVASYAAAAGSKSTNQNQNNHQTESVLDSWEEAAQNVDRSQELERSIEEKLDKMKQKQSGMQSTAPDSSSNNSLDDRSLPPSKSQATDNQSSVDLTNAAPASSAPMIRILKRPQSSGHLPQHGQYQQQPSTSTSDQSKQSAPRSSASTDGRYSRNGNSGRGGSQQQQQRTLEERAAAYAEARMRIFGVADQQIHDDLPVQPKLSMMPKNDDQSNQSK